MSLSTRDFLTIARRRCVIRAAASAMRDERERERNRYRSIFARATYTTVSVTELIATF